MKTLWVYWIFRYVGNYAYSVNFGSKQNRCPGGEFDKCWMNLKHSQACMSTRYVNPGIDTMLCNTMGMIILTVNLTQSD